MEGTQAKRARLLTTVLAFLVRTARRSFPFEYNHDSPKEVHDAAVNLSEVLVAGHADGQDGLRAAVDAVHECAFALFATPIAQYTPDAPGTAGEFDHPFLRLLALLCLNGEGAIRPKGEITSTYAALKWDMRLVMVEQCRREISARRLPALEQDG